MAKKSYQNYALSGRITNSQDEPLEGLIVCAFDQDPNTPDNPLGNESITDAEGCYLIYFSEKDFQIPFESGGPDVFLRVYDSNELLGESPVKRNAKERITIDLQLDYAGPAKPRDRVVRGRILSQKLRGLTGLRAVAVDKNVGGEMLLGEGTSSERGVYEIRYSMARLEKEKPDVQVQVTGENGEVLAASAIRYNAGPVESGLNIVIPADKLSLPAEYLRLIGEMAPHLGNLDEWNLKKRLTELKEDDEQQDITYLANKTGWDARMVAMTALASQFAERSDIEPEFYYALFRAGVPANEAVLSRMDPKTVQQVWGRAVDQQILPAELKDKISDSLKQFKEYNAGHLLEVPAQIGISSFKELIGRTLSKKSEQKQFAQLYYKLQGDLEGFWKQARKKFGEERADSLKLDGKLGFLTINNAPIISKLHDKHPGMQTPLDLVAKDLYRQDNWMDLLGKVDIPNEVPGETPEERKGNYAAFMASQLRLSYPTAVVAQMIKEGAIPLHTHTEAKVKEAVTTFLDAHQGKFELGVHPVEQYLQNNGIELDDSILTQLKKLQRVYQISPSDEAMGKLLEHNLDSAYAVVRYDEQTFVKAFKGELGGEAMARLTYAKAHQVHNAVLNIAVAYVLEKSAYQPYAIENLTAMSGTETDSGSGVLANSTLEELFGEMDYCACEQCRSWLSPAAYLVDLLHFLDQSADNEDGSLDENNPLDVLLGRRPDIQFLQLTCENTNTMLPYIDLVNEILEHYVVYDSLKTFKGHNIDASITTEELLANPQYVNDAAYRKLGNSLFPPPLPFHQPLEALRRYFEHFNLPLYEAMEGLRSNDNPERADNASNPDDRDLLNLPLHEAEGLQPNIISELVDGTRNPAYGWQDILMEQLQISRQEFAILTDGNTPLQKLYGKDATELSNAKTFARQLGLSYEELIEIISTQFINPYTYLIPKLEKLHVSFAKILAFIDGSTKEADFEALLPDGLDEAPYGGDAKKWLQDNKEQIMGLIVLSDPTGSEDICSFDALKLRYANGEQLHEIEFRKLLRFIRLWSKLGWSIEQTDKAIASLYPADQYPLPTDNYNSARSKLDEGFRILILRLAHLQTVMERLGLTKRDPTALLTFWSSIDTHGSRSLYRQMFLNPTILSSDEVFREDGYGSYLADKKEYKQDGAETPKLLDHVEALRSAFNLTQEEFDQILQELNFHEKTVLNLANVSAIFRHGHLARHLRLSVQEFLALKTMSGLDPFQPLDLVQPPEKTKPLGAVRPQAIRFTELAQLIKDSPFKVGQLQYYLQHIDLSGKASPPQESVLSFARTLRNDMLRIDRENTVQDDPSGEIARTKMALVYGAEATDIFFGLLNNTSKFSVDYSQPQPALENDIIAVTDHITYDDFREQLSFRGVMTAEEKSKLESVTSDNTAFCTAVQKIFEAGQKAFAAFFNRYPELQPLYDAYMFFSQLRTLEPYDHAQETLEKAIIELSSGRLSYNDTNKQLLFLGVMDTEVADKLKSLDGVSDQFKEAADNLHRNNQYAIDYFFDGYHELEDQRQAYLEANISEERQRSVLLANFLPAFRQQLKYQQVRQAISTQLGADLILVTSLLENATLLHALSEPAEPAIADFLTPETQGLSADIFFADDVTGIAVRTDIVGTIDYRIGGTTLPPNPGDGDATVSGVWQGFLEAPDNGSYNFYIEADSGAEVSMVLDGGAVFLGLNNGVMQNREPVELKAGRLYELAFTAKKVRDLLVLKWERKGMGREPIPAAQLYPAAPLACFKSSYLRLLKALAIAESLSLSSAELEHFAAHKDYMINGKGWLNALPVAPSSDGKGAQALLRNVLALLQYRNLRETLKIQDERLLEMLKEPDARDESGVLLLQRIIGWQEIDLDALMSHFGLKMVDLAHLQHFARLYESFEVIKKLGIGADVLVNSTTNEPKADALRALQAALRARYDQRAWLGVIQPINDELRSLKRDALVAYVLHRLKQNGVIEHIDTPDRLFEYLLIDAEMDPCMKTSRIKQAISSVQLFVQRCLLNLEQQVASSAINADLWEWMKRYRFWEANRKVFLWPENWLEPELRDNKSPFFKDLESELLQSDITEDAAATALVHYLEKLDDVAKLEICGMYYEEHESNSKADDVIHVIGRTAGARRTYYYRRQVGGVAWTPWEKIDLNIEDKPVLPVVWRGRLFLFWLSVLQEAPTDSSNSDSDTPLNLTSVKPSELKGIAGEAKIRVTVTLYWSEYYQGKWQPARTSDVNKPLVLGDFKPGVFDRAKVKLSSLDWNGLNINVAYGDIERVAQKHKSHSGTDVLRYSFLYRHRFILYNTHSLPFGVNQFWDILQDRYRSFTFSTEGSKFTINYSGIANSQEVLESRDVLENLENASDCEIIQPLNLISDSDIFEAPFFFQDARHVFFVISEKSLFKIDEWIDVGTMVDASVGEPSPLDESDIINLPPEEVLFGFYPLNLGGSMLGNNPNIKNVLKNAEIVQFGDRWIGPSGSLASENEIRQRLRGLPIK